MRWREGKGQRRAMAGGRQRGDEWRRGAGDEGGGCVGREEGR